MKTLIAICRALNDLDEAELRMADQSAQRQSDYNHPFKMAAATRQQNLGAHNKAVIAKIRELRTLIKAGEKI